MTNNKSNILPIVVMYLLFFMIAFVTNLCNPMAVIVKNNFEMSNFAAQLGNAANFIAYAVMGIPAGMLLKKIGYRKTALVAILVGFIGVFLQYMSGWAAIQSFGVYLAGAFIAGFCMCMLNTVVNPMLNTLGGGGNKGNQLVQFGGVCNSLAAVLVTIIMGSLIADATKAQIADATPALMIALGVFAFAFLVLLLVKIPEPELEISNSDNKATNGKKYSAFSFRHFNLGILAIFLYMGVEVGVPTYVMQYLTTAPDAATPGLGINAGIVGMIVAVYWLLMLVGRLLGGMLAGKVSSRAQITGVSIMCLVLVLLGMFLPSDVMVKMPGIDWATLTVMTAQVPVGIFALILVGLCTSVMWGGIFNMAVEGLGKYTSIASGAFMTMVCGGGILIPLQGKLADVFGDFQMSYIVVLVCAAYILFYALIGSKNVNKDIPTE
ncbi:MAG: MFS transporter [Paludibacteraceae bacterium]|jgi:FHS family L-fucose permease-like MFS transporter|nr:MFS transporter [Paludibacteraceae bacterium]